MIERYTKAPEPILYSTLHLPETKNLYYGDHKLNKFEATILSIFANV